MIDAPDETDAVRERYARREVGEWRYHPLNPSALAMAQERERAIARGLRARGWSDPSTCRLAEVGSGSGGNLLQMLRLGFTPSNLTGIELLPERHAQARSVLPDAVTLQQGDATRTPLPDASQHIVLQSTVFSSLLDDGFQQRLASVMWRWLKPGGAVLWYDFCIDNPRNADVRGVPLARVKALFPRALVHHEKLTLAPPIARAVTRLNPSLYTVFNTLPLLRTHLLAWIEKPTT